MLSVKRTIFLEFQLLLDISSVFGGGIVFPLAISALKSYFLNYLLLTRHNKTPLNLKTTQLSTYSKNPALDQNRTDDLILTMDMLCQLSYKGKLW